MDMTNCRTILSGGHDALGPWAEIEISEATDATRTSGVYAGAVLGGEPHPSPYVPHLLLDPSDGEIRAYADAAAELAAEDPSDYPWQPSIAPEKYAHAATVLRAFVAMLGGVGATERRAA